MWSIKQTNTCMAQCKEKLFYPFRPLGIQLFTQKWKVDDTDDKMSIIGVNLSFKDVQGIY